MIIYIHIDTEEDPVRGCESFGALLSSYEFFENSSFDIYFSSRVNVTTFCS